MPDAALTSRTVPTLVIAPGTARLQSALLWLVGIGGAFVSIEPSAYEVAILCSIVVFYATGMRMRMPFVPLLAMIVLLNLGYTISAADMLGEKVILNWILTSWYMAVTTLFFALVFCENTAERIDMLRRGLIIGAVLTSLAGIVGYFNLLPGANAMFTLYGRAMGAFKDPNVFSAFLILPAMFALQSVVSDSAARSFRSLIVLGIITIAIFLAFSRAAWGMLVLSAAFMLFMMVLTSSSAKQRSRIIGMAIAGVVLAGFLLAVLLSFDSISSMFSQRASLNQSYDGGRFGRFGRHLLGAQMALDLPFGIGPLQFTKFFPEDTHNSYLNAFMSGGWISGICFPVLVLITVVLGFRMSFTRVPWQRAYLAIFAVFLATVGVAFVIDVDHWRHFWMLLGLMWALFVAGHQYRATSKQITG